MPARALGGMPACLLGSQAWAAKLLCAAEERAQALAQRAAEHSAELARLRTGLEHATAHSAIQTTCREDTQLTHCTVSDEGSRQSIRVFDPNSLPAAFQGEDLPGRGLSLDLEDRDPRNAQHNVQISDNQINQLRACQSNDNLFFEEDFVPELLLCWKQKPENAKPCSQARQPIHRKPHHKGHTMGESETSTHSYCVISPTSKIRVIWDLCSAAIIGYDLLAFPLDAFNYSDWWASQYFSLACLIFWTSDVVISFFCGFFRQDGAIERRLRKTAAKYFRTWFFFDLFIVAMDWAMMMMESTMEEALSAVRLNKIVRFVRISKVMRLSRIIRVIKLGNLCRDVSDFILSAHVLSMLNVVKLLALMAIVLHYIACMWYMIGKETGQSQESWLTEWLDKGYSSQDFYLISFHWAIAQFTPAPIPFGPVNQRERFFNVCALFIGVAVVSSIIGSLTALISQSRQKAYEQIVQDDALRKFLMDNQVTQELGRRITRFCKRGHGKEMRMTEDMLPMLQTLPGYLRKDMRFEVHMGKLGVCPFLQALNEVQEVALRSLCDTGIIERPVDNGSVPFYNDTECANLYFLLFGHFVYLPNAERTSSCWSTSRNKDVLDVQTRELHGSLHHGNFLCEPALWCKWRHQGLLQANSSGLLLILSTKTFGQIMSEHPGALIFCCEHAQAFIQEMLACHASNKAIDDLFHPFEDEAAVLNSVPSFRPRSTTSSS